jgi:hypothetical protein
MAVNLGPNLIIEDQYNEILTRYYPAASGRPALRQARSIPAKYRPDIVLLDSGRYSRHPRCKLPPRRQTNRQNRKGYQTAENLTPPGLKIIHLS